MSKQIQLPSPGRIVDFTWGGGSGPAIVLSANGSKVTLQVFSEANGLIKRENVEYSEEKTDHTWCYPEKVNGTFEYGTQEQVKEVSNSEKVKVNPAVDTPESGALSSGDEPTGRVI